MYRARFPVQVKYGHFAEYLKIAEQLNEPIEGSRLDGIDVLDARCWEGE